VQVDQKRCQVDLSLREPSAVSEKLEAGALVNGQIIHVSGTFAICLFPIVLLASKFALHRCNARKEARH
jgi:hypothetical protein